MEHMFAAAGLDRAGPWQIAQKNAPKFLIFRQNASLQCAPTCGNIIEDEGAIATEKIQKTFKKGIDKPHKMW